MVFPLDHFPLLKNKNTFMDSHIIYFLPMKIYTFHCKLTYKIPISIHSILYMYYYMEKIPSKNKFVFPSNNTHYLHCYHVYQIYIYNPIYYLYISPSAPFYSPLKLSNPSPSPTYNVIHSTYILYPLYLIHHSQLHMKSICHLNRF